MSSEVSKLTFGYIFESLAIHVLKKRYPMFISLKVERISFDQIEHFLSFFSMECDIRFSMLFVVFEIQLGQMAPTPKTLMLIFNHIFIYVFKLIFLMKSHSHIFRTDVTIARKGNRGATRRQWPTGIPMNHRSNLRK